MVLAVVVFEKNNRISSLTRVVELDGKPYDEAVSNVISDVLLNASCHSIKTRDIRLEVTFS